MDHEVATLAKNLARNCNFAVFPCRLDKRPATPHGFKDAVTDPDDVVGLWQRHPGELIGIATGERSGIAALDIDIKHSSALAWWRQRERRFPATRAYRTRSGGLHLYFQHRHGIGSKAGKGALLGVDTRGDGGYVISWWAAGNECLDHTPPAPWPDWLAVEMFPPPPVLPRVARQPHGSPDARLTGLLRQVETAAEGQRNQCLFWAACRAGELVRAGAIGAGEAERMLAGASRSAGLTEREAAATITSGLGTARGGT